VATSEVRKSSPARIIGWKIISDLPCNKVDYICFDGEKEAEGRDHSKFVMHFMNSFRKPPPVSSLWMDEIVLSIQRNKDNTSIVWHISHFIVDSKSGVDHSERLAIDS
jgi:hypothetical protein